MPPELDATPPPAMNRIDRLFARRRAEGRSALMPFLTAGDRRWRPPPP